MKIQRSNERGLTEIGWLTSYHSFSFGDYYNPEQMGYRSLRVINDDIIKPGQGFGTHGHRDMEIISFVLRGSLAHRDSMGHEEILRPGEVQVMSAGRGIEHSEYNPSNEEESNLFQIWITPDRRGLTPSYAQHPFREDQRRNNLLRVAGPVRDTADGALLINQDADLFVSRIEPGHSVQRSITSGRGVWIHILQGTLEVRGTTLHTGDAVSLEGPVDLDLKATSESAEIFCFDLR